MKPTYFCTVLFLTSSLLTISATTQAQDFFLQLIDPQVDSSLYNHCGEICPEIDFKFVQTAYPWLDDTINKDIMQSLAVTEQLDGKKKQSTAFDKNAHPTSRQYAEQINTHIRELIALNKDLITVRGENSANNLTPLVQVTAHPRYIGHKTIGQQGNLELFATDFYQYTGGAHGLGTTTYYVFDSKRQQHVTLNDVLLPQQRSKLESLAKAEFAKQLNAQKINVNEHFKAWEFHLTDNFSFDQTGLTLLYQPYEIAYYALGAPKISIPYHQLTGIIKAQYLP